MNITQPVGARPAQEVYRMLKDLFLMLDDADRQFFGEYGLSTRQFWALHHLSEEPSLSMTELSRFLLTDKSNTTAIADSLERAGLVQRSSAPRDRRVTLLLLTPAGRERHTEVLAAHERRIEALLGTDETALHAAATLLDQLHERVGEQLHPGRAELIGAQSAEPERG